MKKCEKKGGRTTVCQLAYEAEFKTDYFSPEFIERKAIWDAAWRAAWKASNLIYRNNFK